MLLLILLLPIVLAQYQSSKFDLRVKGVLKCGEYPAATVRVRLWKDNAETVLDETYVDKSGHFNLSATTIQRHYTPLVVIYHDCDDGVKPGQRKLKFEIPPHYIYFGESEKKVFDLGEFNLETVMKYNEERQQYVDKRKRRTIHEEEWFHDVAEIVDAVPKQRRRRHHKRCLDCELKRTTPKSFEQKYAEPDDRNEPW